MLSLPEKRRLMISLTKDIQKQLRNMLSDTIMLLDQFLSITTIKESTALSEK